MKYSLKHAVVGVAALFAVCGSAQAATITFDSFVSTTDNPVIDTAPTVSVNDDTMGVLTFTISTPNANGLLSGVWIDFIGGPSLAIGNLTSLTGGISIVDFFNNTNDIGNGRALDGNFSAPISGPSGNFTIGFGFNDGQNGGDGRQVVLPLSFTVDDLGSLTLASISRIGLRFQSVGSLDMDGLGGGSEKLISVGQQAVVPLPAAGWMLISGLAGFGFFGRKKSAQLAK